MYRCLNCNKEFAEPLEKQTNYESYYGVSSDFMSNTPLTLYLCPSCRCDDIEKVNDEEESSDEMETK